MKLLMTCFVTVLLSTHLYADPALIKTPLIFKSWRVAFVRNDSIYTAKADGTDAKLIVKNAGAPCWSPDKHRLAYYSGGNIWIIGADGKGKRQLTHYGKQRQCNTNEVRISWNHKTNGITFSHPYWLNFGNNMVCGSNVYDLYPVISGKPIISVRFDVTDGGTGFNFTNNENPAWSKDGENLAFTRNGDIWIAEYSCDDGGIRAGWDIRRIAAVAEYDSPTNRCSRANRCVTHLSWSPDGEYLSYCKNRLGGSGSYDLHVLKLQDNGFNWVDTELINDRMCLSNNESAQPTFDCFSPDGKWIAFTNVDTIYAVSLDGKQLVKILSNAEQAVW